MNYDELDPGIRDTVRLLRDAGFDTTDSGDGVSKSPEAYAAGEAMPFPHVAVNLFGGCGEMFGDFFRAADRLADILGPGWRVEASYCPNDSSLIAMAFKP